jgi:hypothetical protein
MHNMSLVVFWPGLSNMQVVAAGAAASWVAYGTAQWQQQHGGIHARRPPTLPGTLHSDTAAEVLCVEYHHMFDFSLQQHRVALLLPACTQSTSSALHSISAHRLP